MTDIELRVSTKNLGRMEDELLYMKDVLHPKRKLALELAPLEYEFQFNQMTEDFKKLDMTIKVSQKQIDILQDQIENGVEEIKEDKK